jgi:rRNA maturation RNase YbeY
MASIENSRRSKVVRIVVNGSVPAAFGVTRAEIKAAAEFFAERSRARVGGVWHEVTVHLMRDEASDAMHRAIMGVPGATDVITQAYDAIPPETPGLFGELFVNTDQALRAAPSQRGWSPAKELLLYIAHGMDHLSGADDHSERGYLAMRRRELTWLRSLNA